MCLFVKLRLSYIFFFFSFEIQVGRVLHLIETASSSAELLAECVSKEAEASITTGNELTQLAQSLYKWTLESPERASHTAIVCNAIGKLERDDVKFRSPFLQPLKNDYYSREKWSHDDENKWLSLACLLCQFFKEVKVQNKPIGILEQPTLTCIQEVS